MAESGRKIPDFQSYISKSLAEHFDNECYPCLTTGQHVEADGFCMDCSEYLCKSCYSSHQKTKASRHHQLLDKDNMGNHTDTFKVFEVYIKKCSSDLNVVIKFFCPQHKDVGCHDNITMNHKTCTIDYKPDLCTGIVDSAEYKDTMQLLNHKLKEIDAVRDKEINTCHEKLIQEIVKLRKETNDRLDLLQNVIETDADRKKSDNKHVKEVFQACTYVSTDINKLKSGISTSNNCKQNGQLYNNKQAQSQLKSDEVKKTKESLEKADKDLENTLSNQNMPGKCSTDLAVSMKKAFLNPSNKDLSFKEEINVVTKSDRFGCHITGCAVLPSNKIVLANGDHENSKLKVVDIQKKVVIEEKTLNSRPFDIAVLPHDQIAVTLAWSRQIIIMNVARNLSTVSKIGIEGRCYGITYHQDHLYVVCQDPKSVLVLDTQGDEHSTISLNDEIFKSPQYIVVSEDSRRIYITDNSNYIVASLTSQGDVSAVYKHKGLHAPWGIVMLDDGSLLVCCWNSTVHHISGDLKQGMILIDNIPGRYCICYSHQHDEVYIGGIFSDLKCYSLK